MCLLAQPQGQQQFKNKKQPELTKNQTVWKSDNQGDKEETFIQTGKRGRDRQPGWRGLAARRRLANPASWWIVEPGKGGAKLQLASEAAAGGLGDRLRNPGLQCREIKPQTTD